MTLLSKSQILAAADLVTEDVEVPEWGGTVRVRAITAAERDAFETSVVGDGKGKRNLVNLRARLVALAIVDDAGQRLFSDGEAEALGGKSGAAMDRVYAVAQRLSGLTERDVKELEGNSGAAR